ncbi:UPF0301 protein YqgE [hydrothermal vent metagenome]|uniref:UPF0301 protein YqgE n=1 Tax=hydrothermal vent metagenome TaxID=652676 RepID=A0A3B0TJT1_9ZZZZ
MVDMKTDNQLCLQGQFLVAMPLMGDPRFHESVIYVVEHNANGAMAIIINHPVKELRFIDVLSDLGLGEPEQLIRISDDIAGREVLRGGPVETARGFVLHSPDFYREETSFVINSDICLSASIDVLKAMAFNSQAKNKALFALGYCGWSAGQLEAELAQNAWLTVPHSIELIFEVPVQERYEAALELLGINRASLSAFSGRA